MTDRRVLAQQIADRYNGYVEELGVAQVETSPGGIGFIRTEATKTDAAGKRQAWVEGLTEPVADPIREQLTDALELIDAYIAARAAHDAYFAHRTTEAQQNWHAAAAHADELLEVYYARYGHTR